MRTGRQSGSLVNQSHRNGRHSATRNGEYWASDSTWVTAGSIQYHRFELGLGPTAARHRALNSELEKSHNRFGHVARPAETKVGSVIKRYRNHRVAATDVRHVLQERIRIIVFAVDDDRRCATPALDQFVLALS